MTLYWIKTEDSSALSCALKYSKYVASLSIMVKLAAVFCLVISHLAKIKSNWCQVPNGITNNSLWQISLT